MSEITTIENKIYEIRGQKVMLDSDLAKMYGVETRVLNQAVKRNIERFPEDFRFQLTKGEVEILKSQIKANNIVSVEDEASRSQIVTLNTKRGSNIKYLPYVFTENGVAMLSSVLRSPLAIQVNISIMRAFTEVRKMITFAKNDDVKQLRKDFEELKQDLEELFSDQADVNEQTRMQLLLISDALAQLQSDTTINKRQTKKIGYKINTKK